MRQADKADMTEEKPKMDAATRIDANLKKVYQEMVETEIPDRFQQLIEQLKKQGKST